MTEDRRCRLCTANDLDALRRRFLMVEATSVAFLVIAACLSAIRVI